MESMHAKTCKIYFFLFLFISFFVPPLPYLGIASRVIKPTIGIVDPLNTLSLPPAPTIASALDQLCHSIESYPLYASSIHLFLDVKEDTQHFPMVIDHYQIDLHFVQRTKDPTQYLMCGA